MAIKKGLDITRESWEVLKLDRELLIFPLFSTIAGISVFATIILAGVLIPSLGEYAVNLVSILEEERAHSVGEQAIGILCLFLIYFVQWSIVVFFNTALVGCALIRFAGGDPTVKDGFRIAFQRLPQVLAWALFTSVVGTILSTIEQKLGWLGRFILRFIGLAWAVATYFVVPVLAAEGTGPITAVKRSISLLKKTWGEGLVGNFAIRLISTAVGFVIIFVAVAGIVLAVYLESIAVGIVVISLVSVSLLLVGVVTSALKQVFLAGLYQYALTGEAPSGFSEETLKAALKQA